MSTQNIPLNTGQQAIIDTDTAKIFLWDNRYENALYENTTGGEVTLEAGTVMGRISATGKLLPLDATAIDGSDIPVGILNQKVVVADTVEVTVAICVAGDVAEEKVIFFTAPTDTFATLVAGRQLRDRIGADTVGIKLVLGTELTTNDNS